MMTALATVTSVTQMANVFEVELSCEQQTSCNHCASQKSCGTGIISKAVGNKSHKWQLETDKKVHAGQIVEIGLPEKSFIQFASLVYLLPLAMLFFGAIVGQLFISPALGGGEGPIILVSAIFMALGVWITRKLATKLQLKSEQSVILLRIMGDAIEVASK